MMAVGLLWTLFPCLCCGAMFILAKSLEPHITWLLVDWIHRKHFVDSPLRANRQMEAANSSAESRQRLLVVFRRGCYVVSVMLAIVVLIVSFLFVQTKALFDCPNFIGAAGQVVSGNSRPIAKAFPWNLMCDVFPPVAGEFEVIASKNIVKDLKFFVANDMTVRALIPPESCLVRLTVECGYSSWRCDVQFQVHGSDLVFHPSQLAISSTEHGEHELKKRGSNTTDIGGAASFRSNVVDAATARKRREEHLLTEILVMVGCAIAIVSITSCVFLLLFVVVVAACCICCSTPLVALVVAAIAPRSAR